MDELEPEIIHAHHPFLLGTTALREAAARRIPIVFTHHTRYEFFTSYVPLEFPAMQTYAIKLTTGFADLCDAVIAPSESIKEVLRERAVQTPVRVIPTGLDVDTYADGDGSSCRAAHSIPDDALVIGHVGRLAEEKNLDFFAVAVAEALAQIPNARLLVVGEGSARESMEHLFAEADLDERVHFAGKLVGDDVVDAYHAMDVFAFTSTTETQGMVLVEALSAGCPVVALHAAGAREVVRDGENGRLVEDESAAAFAEGIKWVYNQVRDGRTEQLHRAARESARPFDIERCAGAALDLYREVLNADRSRLDIEKSELWSLLRTIRNEWDIWANRVGAAARAVTRRQKKGGSGN
jgi:glycosyltransferase involved in cell wall biosynthesis